MISKSIFLIKVLLVIGCFLFPRWLNRSKGVIAPYKPGYAVGVLLCLVLAQLVTSLTPALTERVTLTALGEKNPEARTEEVYLHNFTIDGKDAAIKSPIDGKWFWIENTYAWRIESDMRQPEGTTRSIVLNVPVGWSRTANFEGAIWRGKVEITTSQGTQVADTYSETDAIVQVELGRSETSQLILNQLLQLTVFAAVLLAGTWCCLRLSKSKALHSPQWRMQWWGHYGGKSLYGAIALVAFFGMIALANRQSFWADEVATVAFVQGTLKDAISYNVKMQDITPPLFNICAWFWYRIAPYGQHWLLLISIVPTALSVYVAGLIGECVRNRFCGVLTAMLLAFSNTVWINQAHEFRSYAFLGLFSTLTLYCFIRRNEKHEGWKWHVLLGLSMTAMAMSHYFGMLACGCIFFVDFLLFLRKKLKVRAILPYLIAGSVSSAWLILVYATTLSQRSTASIANWYPVPTLQHVSDLLHYLAGNQLFTWGLFLLGISTGVVAFLWKSHEHNKKNLYYAMSLWIICFPVGLLFIYGNYINQSSTMWQTRYFLFLPIYFALISSIGVTDLIALLGNRIESVRLQAVIGGFLILSLSFNCFVSQSSLGPYQPYKEAADWLTATQTNYVYNSDTLIVGSVGNWYVSGWDNYFITRQGKRDDVNMCVSHEKLTESDLQFYNRIYVQYSHVILPSWIQEELNANFTAIEYHPEVQITIYQRNIDIMQEKVERTRFVTSS